MFDIDEDQKLQIIIEICKKIDIVSFKYLCIKSKFKNVPNKYSDFNYIIAYKSIDNWSMYQISELENNYKNQYKKLLGSSKNIDLLEDQDINYFIKYYNITFEEDNKPFCIEI